MMATPPRWASMPTTIGNFSNRFYTGQFEGSFARGVPFQENLETGDMRIAGTLASLAGLELAIERLGSDEELGIGHQANVAIAEYYAEHWWHSPDLPRRRMGNARTTTTS